MMDGNPGGSGEGAVTEQVITETVSDEFLQNVQSAVNSTGVLGRVGVIETENGPMTVIFMEEGADASELGLTDGAVIGTEDGNQIEYRVLEEGFAETTLEEGQVIDTTVSQAAAIMDTIVSTAGDGVVAIDTSAGGGSGVVAAIEQDTGVSAMEIGQEVMEFEQTPIEQTVHTDSIADVAGGTVFVTESGEVISSDGGTFIIQDGGQIVSQGVSTLGGHDSFIQVQGQDAVNTVVDENTYLQIRDGGTVISSESLSSATTVQTVPADYPVKMEDNMYVQVSDVGQMQSNTFSTDTNAFVNIEESTRVNTNADGSPFIQVYTNHHGDVTEVQYTAVKLEDQQLGSTAVKLEDQQLGSTAVKLEEPQLGSTSILQRPVSATAPAVTPKPQVLPKPAVLPSTQTSVLIPQFPSASRRMGTDAFTSQKLITAPAVPTGLVKHIQPTKSAAKTTYAIQQAGKMQSVSAIGGKSQVITIPKFANVASTIHTAPTLQNIAKKPKPAVAQLPAAQAVTFSRKPAGMTTQAGKMVAYTQSGKTMTYGTTTTISKKQLVEQELLKSKSKQSVPAKSTGVQYVDIHGQLITQQPPAQPVKRALAPAQPVKRPPAQPVTPKVPEKVATTSAATPVLPQTTGIPQTIKVPNSDITIQLYQDGTLVTRDKMGTNYSQLKLEDLGLDKSMLTGETNIELVVVQSDGKEVRATIKTHGAMFQTPGTPAKSASPAKTAIPVKSPSKTPMSSLQGPVTPTQTAMESPVVSQFNTTGVENQPAEMKPEIEEGKPILGLPDGDPRPYKCSMCPRTFKFYRTYKCHEIVHFKATNFTCPLCKRLFARETNLNSHLELHRKKSKEAVLKSVANMTRVKKYTPPKKEKVKGVDSLEWKCGRCNEFYPTSLSLQKHKQNVHNDNDQMSCPICKKVFKTKFGVQRHLKLHVSPFRCIFCDAFYDDKDALITHVKEVHPKKNYSCTICLESLQTKKSYWSHIKDMHGDSKEGKELLKSYAVYECSYCIKRFHKHAVLSRHLLVHSEKKKFACPHCLYRFNKDWKLQAHIQRLHKSDHNPCKKCGKVFKFSKELDRHISTFHAGPYTCDSCETLFDDLSLLDDHAFSEHNVTHPCKVCTEIFKTRLTLSFHNDADHTTANTCLCDLCGEGFMYKTKLKAHLVNVHFDGDREEMYHDYPEMKRVKDWKGPYECKICIIEVRYRVALKLHYLNNHFKNDPTAMYEAYPYLKEFPDPQDNVVCDHCGKCFMQMTHLNMHLRTHGVHVSLSSGNEKSMEKLTSSSEEEEEEDEIVYIESPEKDKGADNKLAKEPTVKKEDESQNDENDPDFDPIGDDDDIGKYGLKKEKKLKTSTPKPKASKSKKRKSSVLLICQDCEEIFKTEEDFDDHMESEHGKAKKTRTKMEVDDESPEETEEIAVPKELQNRWLKVCKLCTKSFTQIHSLRNHAEKVHPDEVEEIMEGISEKKPGRGLAHSTYKKVECPECSELMSSAYSLHRHMDRIHGIRTVGSPGQVVTQAAKKKATPKKSSARKSVSKANTDTSSDMSSFLGMNFSLEKKRGATSAASPSKNHRCKTCGESFHRMATLKKHERTHEAASDESELDEEELQKALYKCKDCDNTYSTISGLVFHTKNKHPDVDDTALKTKLTKEEKEQKPSVDGNRGGPSYPCDECGKLYFTVGGVLYHVRTRHPELDDIEIRTKLVALEKQRKGVTPKKKIEKEPLFPCEACDVMYHTVGGVLYHIRTRHPELDEQEVRARLIEMEKAIKLEESKNPIKAEDDKEAVKIEDEVVSVKKPARSKSTGPEKSVSTKTEEIKKEFECKICGSMYSSLKGLEMHEELIHPIHKESKKVSKSGRIITKSKRLSDYFECPECSKIYSEELHLKQHMQMKHKIDVFTKKGKEVFTKKGKEGPIEDNKHFRKTPKGYVCNSCKKFFAKYLILVRHMKMQHRIRISRAQEDAADTKDIKDENDSIKSQGVKTRSGKSNLSGEVCDKELVHKSRKHLATEHANIKKAASLYSCTKCPRNFKSRGNMTNHMKSHGSESTETNLKSHKLSDTQTTSTVTRSKVELKALKGSKQVKDYKCKLCSRLFTSEWTLESHMRHVHKEKEDSMKNYKCKQCSRQFTAEWTLQSHIRHVHKSSGVPLKKKNVDVIAVYKSASRTCKYCEKQFTRNWGLKLHVTNVHKKIVTEWKLPPDTATGKSQKSQNDSRTLSSKNAINERKSSRQSASTAKDKSEKPESKALHVCEECKKTFSTAGHLKQHQRVHKAKKEKEESSSGVEKETDDAEENDEKEMVDAEESDEEKETANAEESDDDSISQRELMSRPVVQQCLYCSDCGQVCWTQQSYTSHLQQFHPEQLAVDTDSADDSFTAENDAKSETMETDDESSKAKNSRRASSAPSKHKCEVCNRVHWTKKSFDDHMKTCHPDKFIEMQEEESAGPAEEFVNDEESSSKYLQIVSHSDVPVDNEKLVAVPMVLLERMPSENESSDMDDADQPDQFSPEPDEGDDVETGEIQENDEHTVTVPTKMNEQISKLENEDVDTTGEKMDISVEDIEQEGNIDSKLEETVETNKAEDSTDITVPQSNDPTISDMDFEVAKENRNDSEDKIDTDMHIDKQTAPENNNDQNLMLSNQECGTEPINLEDNAPLTGENENTNKSVSTHIGETESNLSEYVSMKDDCGGSNVTSNAQTDYPEQSVSGDVVHNASEHEIETSNVPTACPEQSVSGDVVHNASEHEIETSNVPTACPEQSVSGEVVHNASEHEIETSNVPTACPEQSVSGDVVHNASEHEIETSNVPTACPEQSVSADVVQNASEQKIETSNVPTDCPEQSVSGDVVHKSSEHEIEEVSDKSTEDLCADDKDNSEEDYEEITLGVDVHQDHADTGHDHLQPLEQEQVSNTGEYPGNGMESKQEFAGEIRIETVPECGDQIVDEYSERSDEQNTDGAVSNGQLDVVQGNHAEESEENIGTGFISHEQQLTEIPVSEQSTDEFLTTEQFVEGGAGKTVDVVPGQVSSKWEHGFDIEGDTSLVDNVRQDKQTEIGEVGAMNVELDPALGENEMLEGYSGVEVEESIVTPTE